MKTLLLTLGFFTLTVLVFVLIDAIIIDKLRKSNKFYKWWQKHVCEKF